LETHEGYRSKLYQQEANLGSPSNDTSRQYFKITNKSIAGAGDGTCQQMLATEKPTLAVYLAALGLRSNCRHWGPVIRHEVEIRPEAEECLRTISSLAGEHDLCQVFWHSKA
jgi:hypothetical protein